MTFNEITNIKDRANIKPEFNYLGFVLYLPDTDEYVTSRMQNTYIISRVYSSLPERANIYQNENQVFFDSLQIPDHCVVGVLFEANNKYSLAFLDEEQESLH